MNPGFTIYQLHGLQSESRSVVSDSLQPHGLYSPWNSPGQDTGVGSLSLLQGNLPNPGIEPRSSALQADSLPTELSGKPHMVLGKLINLTKIQFSLFVKLG